MIIRRSLSTDLRKGLFAVFTLALVELALFLSVRWNPLMGDALVFLFAIIFVIVAIVMVLIVAWLITRTVAEFCK